MMNLHFSEEKYMTLSVNYYFLKYTINLQNMRACLNNMYGMLSHNNESYNISSSLTRYLLVLILYY